VLLSAPGYRRVMGVSGAVQPPQDLVELQVWSLDDAAQLRSMRAALFEAVTGQEMAAQFTLGGVADKMVLVASELATNALRYAPPPTLVRLSRGGPGFLLDVTDQHDTYDPSDIIFHQPGEGRLWLRMARRLSSEIGWYTSGAGTHVWAWFGDAAEAVKGP
jgi:serine/threonine-protein kinase RsbW